MSLTMIDRTNRCSTATWRLWVDRCGGFELMTGDQWCVGSARPDAPADIQVQADWRRNEGRLIRQGSDYLWRSTDSQTDCLLNPGQTLPIDGTARMILDQPSPLSGTATLSLAPPHRFRHHVDGVLLVDQTVLLGPGPNNHIRCTAWEDSAVMVLRQGIWQAKLKPTSRSVGTTDKANSGGEVGKPTHFIDLVPGQRISIGEIDVTLEQS